MRNDDEEILARLARIEGQLNKLAVFCAGWTDLGTPDGGRHYHPPGATTSRPRGGQKWKDSAERLLERGTP